MKSVEFTDSEFTFLLNALHGNLFYLKRSLDTWQKVCKNNPSVKYCVTYTEKEISSYTSLIEKISSVGGF